MLGSTKYIIANICSKNKTKLNILTKNIIYAGVMQMRVKLKDIFDLQMGKTPSRSNLEYWNTTDYKWISIADLSKTSKYI